MFRLRGGLARDQFGIQNDGLYGVCAAGTKYIVEEYYNTIIEALNFIGKQDIPRTILNIFCALAFNCV